MSECIKKRTNIYQKQRRRGLTSDQIPPLQGEYYKYNPSIQGNDREPPILIRIYIHI